MKGEPVRLKDDPNCASSLRADLAESAAAATATGPTAEALMGAARLRASIEGGAKLSRIGQLANASGAKGLGALFAKASLYWILGTAGAVAVVIGMIAVASTHSRAEKVDVPSPTGLPASALAPPPPATTLESPAPSPASDTVPADPAAANAPPAQASSAVLAPPAHASAEPRQDTVAAEMADLVRLRQRARTDPGGALVAADEGTRRFPTGLFGQEREAIAIGALSQLGRTLEARARARSFLARYPHSPFREKVTQEVGSD